MSDQPPKDPIFDNAPGASQVSPDSIASKEERDRLEKLKEMLPQLQDKFGPKGGRAERFYPYLLVRSVVGDRGDRPINVPFWESPDIWTAPGDPGASPAIPATPGGTVTAGQPTTVYAHVWNLGRAPIAGVKVEFYWFNPSLGIDGAHANLIGYARVDLAPRNLPGCHTLVKCPKAWVPVLENKGHECLVVRVSGIGDPISSSHPWDPWADRHVAQRNISVVAQMQMSASLLQSLEANRFTGTRIQLLQVGEQATFAVALVAPHLTIDEAVQTHILAELRADGSLTLPGTPTVIAGGLSPIHSLASIEQPGTTQPFAVPRIIPHALLNPSPSETHTPGIEAGAAPVLTTLPESGPVTLLNRNGSITWLLNHSQLFTPAVWHLFYRPTEGEESSGVTISIVSRRPACWWLHACGHWHCTIGLVWPGYEVERTERLEHLLPGGAQREVSPS